MPDKVEAVECHQCHALTSTKDEHIIVNNLLCKVIPRDDATKWDKDHAPAAEVMDKAFCNPSCLSCYILATLSKHR